MGEEGFICYGKVKLECRLCMFEIVESSHWFSIQMCYFNVAVGSLIQFLKLAAETQINSEVQHPPLAPIY